MGAVRGDSSVPEERIITNYDFSKSFRPRKNSNAHGHDDVAVAVGLIGERPHLAGGLFVF